MTWGKIDEGLHKSVKWRRATKGARALWITSLSWCMDEMNDGNVPKDMLTYLDGVPGDAASLVKVGLWKTTPKGWRFHDWHEYQPSRKEVQERRAATRARKDRWKQRQGDENGTRSERVPERVPSASGTLLPTRPDPTPKRTNSPLGGNSPEKPIRKHPPTPCGNDHPAAQNCGACGQARADTKAGQGTAEREARLRREALEAQDRLARESEAEQSRAEIEANPEAVQASRERALQLARGFGLTNPVEGFTVSSHEQTSSLDA